MLTTRKALLLTAVAMLPLCCIGQTVEAWVTEYNQNQLLNPQTPVNMSNGDPGSNVTIDLNTTYQTVDGFGFCLTQGSCEAIMELNSTQQDNILHEFFDPVTGMGNDVVRISIGASDLSSHSYSYNDNGPDPDLNNFSLDGPDKTYVIPMLKRILAINPDIKILATPWSAPWWMKDNNGWIGGQLRWEHYKTYADYFVKYLQAMEAEGIDIWALTVQNEPLNDHNEPSMYMSANDQYSFIHNDLGPALDAAGYDPLIIAYDHNLDDTQYPIDVCASPYVDGSAFHLYGGDIWDMSYVYQQTGKGVYFTEQFTGVGGDWWQDFRWHTNNVTMGSMQHWGKTAIEWNLATDSDYGPRTPGGCTSCLGAITVWNSNDFSRNVSYYIIAQFSKFVKTGAVRVGSSTNKGSFRTVAFQNTDGSVVLVISNEHQWGENFTVGTGSKSFSMWMPGWSTISIKWQEDNFVVADFDANTTSACLGNQVTFMDASTGVDGGTVYNWDFGSGANPATATGAGPHNVSYTTSGSKTVELSLDGGASVEQKTNYLTINDAPNTPGAISGSSSVCSGVQNEPYSIDPVPEADSYNWSISGSGASLNSGGGTSATVDFGSSNAMISVSAANSCGTSSFSDLLVNVNSSGGLSAGPINGNSTVCSNSTGVSYSINSVVGAIGYNWSLPSGATIAAGNNTNSITVDFGTNGGDVTVTPVGDCGNGTSSSLSVSVSSGLGTTGSITGNSTPCENTQESYSINAVSGATGYVWTVPSGASIVSGNGTEAITVDLGDSDGNISVTPSGNCGNGGTESLSITLQSIPGSPASITGITTVCPNDNSVGYSIASVAGATNYNWSTTGSASIASGNGSTNITVDFGASASSIQVVAENTCGTSGNSTINVSITNGSDDAGVISGNSSVCENASESYSIATVSGATSYNWVVPSGATITSGDGSENVTVQFSTSSGDISVTPTSSCGNGASSNISVNVSPGLGATGSISGNTTPCENTQESYSVSTVSGAISYNWSVPTGANIISGSGTESITVDFGTTSGSVSVTPVGNCGNGSSESLSISLQTSPNAPNTISGTSTVCANDNGIAYSINPVSGATTYNWSTSGAASIASGNGNTDVTVDFGSASSTLEVNSENACGTSSTISINISITNGSDNAGVISGNTTVCENASETFSIGTVPGATGYTWSVPSGATITSGAGTDYITVQFGTNSGNVSVTPTSSCGNGNPSSTAVTVNTCGGPNPIPDFVANNLAPCIDTTVIITNQSQNVSGSASYYWDFGDDATPASASGTGPFSVKYSTAGDKHVFLQIFDSGIFVENKVDYIKVDDCVTVGFDGNLNDEFVLGPNPLIDVLSITTHSSDYNVLIYSTDGIERYTVNNLKNNQSINLDGLLPGIYLVKISSSTTDFVTKVVKN